MTYFSALPVPETTVGIAFETVRGTPVEPAYWIPVQSPKYKPDLKMLPDEGLRGSMVKIYDEIPGLRMDTHAWDQHPYLDTLPVLLKALLGSDDSFTIAPLISMELEVEAKIGDKKVEVDAVVSTREGDTITIEPGGTNPETRLVAKVVGKELQFAAALEHAHLVDVVVTTAIELVVEAVAGASKIIINEAVADGSWITIGGETHQLGDVDELKPGEWEAILVYPLGSTHAAKALVLGLNQHGFSLLNNEPAEGNQPVSCTLTDFGGEEAWRQLAAAQLNAINISGAADALPKLVVDWFANGAVAPKGAPSPSFSGVSAPAGWTMQASIGGTQIGYLVTWEMDLKRNVKPVPAITGTQAYYQFFAGPLEVTSKLVVLEDPKATWLAAYEAGTPESLDLTLTDVTSGFALNLHSSKSKILTSDLDRTKEWVEVPLEFQLLPTAADALAGGVSPIVATVANGTATEYGV
jgi:hypothetical protein